MVRKGMDLNYSIALITRNLFILLWAKAPQSRFHCTFIVRRTCRRGNRAKSAFPQSCQQQFDIRTSIGQGHDRQATDRECREVSMLRSRFPDLVVDLLPSNSWLDRLALVLNARYISDCLARFGIAPGGGLRGRFRKVCRTSPQTLGILVPKSRANACRVR